MQHVRTHWLFHSLLLGTLVNLTLATSVPAFNPQPDPPAFSMIGITPDQTARLNVVCSNQEVRSVNPGPCRVTLMFLDSQGRELKSETLTLRPGQADFLDLTGSEIPFTRDTNRFELQPCIRPTSDSGRLVSAVQVFDALTGKTSVVVTPLPRLSLLQAGQPSTGGDTER